MPVYQLPVLRIDFLYEQIFARAEAGVVDAAKQMHKQVDKLVPVRKVFRETGAGERGRQTTRALSLSEALAESSVRRRVFLAGLSGQARKDAIARGVGSAFPTDASGRRIRGSQPLVQTAQLSNNRRTFHRANRGFPEENRTIARINGENRLVRVEQVDVGISRDVIDVGAEERLSARGRAELKRAEGPGLGGALKDSVELHNPVVTETSITSYITAGDEDVRYAKYVEFGTRHARAQPFMRPALAQARERYPGILKRHLLGVAPKRRR